jgi:hypothetical protein
MQIMVIALMPRSGLINVEIIRMVHTGFKYGLLLYRIRIALFLGQYVRDLAFRDYYADLF